MVTVSGTGIVAAVFTSEVWPARDMTLINATATRQLLLIVMTSSVRLDVREDFVWTEFVAGSEHHFSTGTFRGSSS